MTVRSTVRQVYAGIVSSARSTGGRAAAMLASFIASSSADEDDHRRELILNVIATLSVSLFSILCCLSLFDPHVMYRSSYNGFLPAVFSALILFYISLLLLSKRGHFVLASYLLVASYVADALYIGWTSGATLPATILLSALVLITASVLIGPTFGFIVSAAVISAFALLGAHEASVLDVPYWRYEELNLTDIIAYSCLLLFMGAISWLSSHEIEKSLKRARTSEKALETERNALEQRVSDRTRAFVASEQARIRDLDKLVEFGKLSQGLLHDLITPLNSVSLQLDRLPDDSKAVGEARELIDKAVNASRRMRSFTETVKHNLKNPGDGDTMIDMTADLAQEMRLAVDTLAYKARVAAVLIDISDVGSVMISAHPHRIHQLFLNLISNAIDSYDHFPDNKQEKVVSIRTDEHADHLNIEIADNGSGMSDECLSKLFHTQFTTKTDGSGIGLTTVKAILDEIGGSISAKSILGEGSSFMITIPYAPRHE